FPYGGWGAAWMGDPDQGIGPQQPGGWIYTTGPFLEEQAVFNLGAGLPWAEKKKELSKQMAAVVPVFNCPSRRSPNNQPARDSSGLKACDGGYAEGDIKGLRNAILPYTLAKTDYAINPGPGHPAYPDYSEAAEAGCLEPNELSENGKGSYPNCKWHFNLATGGSSFAGVSAFRMGAKMGQIIDGASQTILVGEKNVQPMFYSGECPCTGGNPSKGNGGDNNSMYQGSDYDNSRTGQPHQDEDQTDPICSGDGIGHNDFGSAHAGACNISFCDGSVRSIEYEIDEKVFGEFVKRNNRDAL
ncbi:MAG: DUF1559 domain-containing protein, partial [Pirellulales bacterium]